MEWSRRLIRPSTTHAAKPANHIHAKFRMEVGCVCRRRRAMTLSGACFTLESAENSKESYVVTAHIQHHQAGRSQKRTCRRHPGRDRKGRIQDCFDQEGFDLEGTGRGLL